MKDVEVSEWTRFKTAFDKHTYHLPFLFLSGKTTPKNRNASDEGPGRYLRRCPNKKCGFSKSIFTGSILQHSRMRKEKFVQFIWMWLREIKLELLSDFTGLGDHATKEWNRLLIESVILHGLDESDKQIGGPGIVVEIDESKFGKRKYHVSIFWYVLGLEAICLLTPVLLFSGDVM